MEVVFFNMKRETVEEKERIRNKARLLTIELFFQRLSHLLRIFNRRPLVGFQRFSFSPPVFCLLIPIFPPFFLVWWALMLDARFHGVLYSPSNLDSIIPSFWFFGVLIFEHSSSSPATEYAFPTHFQLPFFFIFIFVCLSPLGRLPTSSVRAWRASAVISPMATTAPASARTAATEPSWARLKTPRPFSSWISLYKICKSRANLCQTGLWLPIHMVKGKWCKWTVIVLFRSLT